MNEFEKYLLSMNLGYIINELVSIDDKLGREITKMSADLTGTQTLKDFLDFYVPYNSKFDKIIEKIKNLKTAIEGSPE